MSVVQQGKIIAICVSDKKGIPKQEVESAEVIKDHGILGDAHAGMGIRQISLLDVQVVADSNLDGWNLHPGDFAENILTEGIDWRKTQPGDQIMIGDNVRLILTQKGKECHGSCAIAKRVGHCAMPQEGIFVQVVSGGHIRKADRIRVLPLKEVPSQENKDACVYGTK